VDLEEERVGVVRGHFSLKTKKQGVRELNMHGNGKKVTEKGKRCKRCED